MLLLQMVSGYALGTGWREKDVPLLRRASTESYFRYKR